ncbi:hypothetical protein MMC09_006137 [Bachmanniomyces sp. S44760]|nr:hypothetical protein [Bachmanniomyces sp. S44760]
MLSPITKDATIDSLAEVSEDEEYPQPPGELSTTLAEIQAKQDELTYRANTKISILNFCVERLDSTVLRQLKLTADALEQTKGISNAIHSFAKTLVNHPSLRAILIREGATPKNPPISGMPEPPLVLAVSPTPGSVSETIRTLYHLSLKTEDWRVKFKAIPHQTEVT